jgi:hypothetical protein
MNYIPRPGWFRSITSTSTWRLYATLPRCQPFGHHIRTSSTDSKQNSPDVLRYPNSPNNEHNDIPTYVAYAQRTGLDTSSTTYVGTHYEYTVAAALEKFGFEIKRIGGRGDFGIDLLGTWSVPSSANPLRIFLQCKFAATSTKIGPHLLRELEGAFVGAPPGWRGSGVIGLLVTQKAATKGIRDLLGRSRWPMGFISCSADGKVQQMLWNSRAEEEGLAGMGIGVRMSETKSLEQELVLTWKGKPSSSGKSNT